MFVRSAQKRLLATSAIAAMLPFYGAISSAPAQATTASTQTPTSGNCEWVGENASTATKVSQVMAAMTLTDEINMVSGVPGSPYAGEIAANSRLCLPALTLEDGPAGVGDGMTNVTQLPAPVDAAATWNPTEVKTYGQVIGKEQKAKGSDIDLGPTINITRDPRWGRAFETFGEDPYLNGIMGASEIQGIQSTGTMAQVKHYAVYNQETNRNTPSDDAVISDRTTHEIYLPAFQEAVTSGQPSSVMCSYSTINGTYACQDQALLTGVLKNLWGFTGFVTSDWGANHSTVQSANAGLDMEMPDPGFWGPALQAAVQDGQVPKSRLDDMVSRILSEEFRFGLIDHPNTGSPSAVATTPADVAEAQKISEDGTVLLKNDGGILPLSTSTTKSIAVIGDDAGVDAETAGGGSASVVANSIVTPFQGISARAGSGVKVTYSQGDVSSSGALPPVPATLFTPSQGSGNGLYAQYFNNMTLSGSPVYSAVQSSWAYNWGGQSPEPGVNATQWSVKWTGTFTPTVTGTYTFSTTSDDGSRLYISGNEVVNNWQDQATNTATGTVTLTAGQAVPVEVDYYQDGGSSDFTLGYTPPGQDLQGAAVAAAKAANVAVVFANNFETEGSDLTNIDLSASENNLIEAVAAANPNPIVVLNTGSAVTMPWINSVKGVFEAWYPGQQDGAAIAALLFGDVNPGGKLPVTFPTSLSQTPTANPQQFPGQNGQSDYSEGLLVGYRYYTTDGVAPLFPFGYGLSYTTFSLSNLQLSANTLTDKGLTASATITNTGKVKGSDVVQLYVGDPASTGEPAEQLKHFEKVTLDPGQSQTVKFVISQQDASYWDTAAQSWVAAPGTYQIMVGDSSVNLPLHASVQIAASTGPRSTTLTAPANVSAPGSFTLTETYANGSTAATTKVHNYLTVPNGWTATATSPATSASVAAGGSFATTWKVTIPAGASGGSQTITGQTGYLDGGTNAGSVSVQVPYANLAAAYNNTAIGTTPATANYDGGGYSFNASGLAGAGVSTGAQISAGGLTFNWTNQADQPDDVVTAGQTIDVSGTGNTIGVIGSGSFGTQSGTVTITYSDGSTSEATLSMPDWYADQAQLGSTLVATDPNWNVPPGSTLGSHAVSIYEQDLYLTPGKTPISITLPNDPSLHVFNIAVGTTTAPVPLANLAAAFDNVGVGASAADANYDGTGYSFNSAALASAGLTPGATFTSNGLSFTWPSAAEGTNDNVVANNQDIALSGSGSTLGFVGSGTNGNQSIPVLVTYTDGTSTVVNPTFSDWYSDSAPSGGAIVATGNWNYPPSSTLGNHQVSIYEDSVAIDPTKTVASVTLGANNRFHIFAMAIGS
jgi:beta-glucosidase